MKALELFCGAGGSALGSLNSNVSDIHCIDFDTKALGVLTSNAATFQSKGAHLRIEARNLIIDPVVEFNELDLLVAGPPCQPFSLSGSRRGFMDIRNGFRSVYETIYKCKPRAFIIENVEGISHDKFADELSAWIFAVAGFTGKKKRPARINTSNVCLTGPEYTVFCKVLNAADFGLAQVRKRWISVGIRNDLEWSSFEWPEITHTCQQLFFDQMVDKVYWDEHSLKVPAYQRWWGGSRPGLPPTKTIRWQTGRDAVHMLGRPTHGRGDYSFGHYLRSGARSYRGHTGSWIDFPSKTIKAGNHGVPGGENMFRLLGGRVRYMTLLECAILQGFPADYCFAGGFNAVVRMIGNACPPILIKKIVANVEKVFLAEKASRELEA